MLSFTLLIVMQTPNKPKYSVVLVVCVCVFYTFKWVVIIYGTIIVQSNYATIGTWVNSKLLYIITIK